MTGTESPQLHTGALVASGMACGLVLSPAQHRLANPMYVSTREPNTEPGLLSGLGRLGGSGAGRICCGPGAVEVQELEVGPLVETAQNGGAALWLGSAEIPCGTMFRTSSYT